MEVKKPRLEEDILKHGDVRVPEMTGLAGRGPSRAQVMVHLAGMGLGLLLLFVGLGLGVSRSMWDKMALIPVIAGGALVAAWITINYQFLSTMLKNRKVMVGTNAVFMGILAVILLTMINFISYRHYHKWDLTQARIHTLSSKTTQVLEELDSDVNILIFDRARNRVHQAALTQLGDMMKLYTEASGRVKVQYMKPEVDAAGAELSLKALGLDTSHVAGSYDVFVVCGGRDKMLRVGEMLEWRETGNAYEPYIPGGFKGEQIITSAIVSVRDDRQPKVYVLSGHGERSISDAEPVGMLDLAGSLKRDNLAVEELSGIPDGGIPADAECLMILAPQAKLAAVEIERIRRYLGRGGRVFICLEVQQDSGLEGLLAEWGVKVGDDLVMASDARTWQGSKTAFTTSDFGAHDITMPLANFVVLFNQARSVTPALALSPKVQVTTLVQTSEGSYGETDLALVVSERRTLNNPEEDLQGPLSVAVAVEEAISPEASSAGGERKAARLVVFGDVDIFANQLVTLPYKNLDLCRNSLNWLMDRSELIAIEGRPEVQHLMVVDAAGKRAVFWLLVVGMPSAVLLMGGLVWAVRSYGRRG